jgi:hypothetical protein
MTAPMPKLSDEDLERARRVVGNAGILATVNYEHTCKVIATEFARVRADTLEEAAKVADDFAHFKSDSGTVHGKQLADASNACATMIAAALRSKRQGG